MNDDVSKIFLGPLSLFLSLSLSSVFHLLLAIPRLLSMHNHPTFFFVFFFFTSSFSTSLPAYSRFFFSLIMGIAGTVYAFRSSFCHFCLIGIVYFTEVLIYFVFLMCLRACSSPSSCFKMGRLLFFILVTVP